ncbi:MAG: large subunit ribosomal protein L30 [Saprospiraceae bacterium]|jgi:large subunit ribosomal protein L30
MGKVKIKLVRSTIGKPKDQKETAFALGLRKMNQVVEVESSPQVDGMIKKIKHLIAIEEA